MHTPICLKIARQFVCRLKNPPRSGTWKWSKPMPTPVASPLHKPDRYANNPLLEIRFVARNMSAFRCRPLELKGIRIRTAMRFFKGSGIEEGRIFVIGLFRCEIFGIFKGSGIETGRIFVIRLFSYEIFGIFKRSGTETERILVIGLFSCEIFEQTSNGL